MAEPQASLAVPSKRKLDDVIGALDDALRPSSERPKAPLKRPTPSIYSTLAKYGITTSSTSRRPLFTPLLNKYRRPKPASIPTATVLPPASQYRPSDLSALLARLETFKLSTYSSKPAIIDTAAAALAGWTNDGRERLVCGLCKASWTVAGTAGMSKESADALAERQCSGLIQNHKEGCPWRERQSDPSLYALPLRSPSQLASDIVDKATVLEPLLQEVRIQHPLSEQQMTLVMKAVTSHLARIHRRNQRLDQGGDANPSQNSNDLQPMSPPPPEKAILTALFGWDPVAAIPSMAKLYRSSSVVSLRSAVNSRAGTPAPGSVSEMGIDEHPVGPLEPKTTMLCCKMCHRRIALWSFIPKDHNDINPKSLDLAREHRSFCPYVSRSAGIPSLGEKVDVQGIELKPGYETLVDTLMRYGMGEEVRLQTLLGNGGLAGARLGSAENALQRSNGEVLRYVRSLLG